MVFLKMHQVLFTIKQFKLFGITFGPWDIYSYAVMFVIAICISLFCAAIRAKKKNLPSEMALDIGLYIVLSGVIGARLIYVLLHLSSYHHNLLQMINLRTGGLSWHGALLGGLIAIVLYCLKNKLSIGAILDLFSPSFILGLAIGRIGCFLNGCCYGKIASGNLGKFFTKFNIPQGRHPAQLYELFLDLIVFFLLLWWDKKTKFSGELYLVFLMLYSAVRFIVEFYRFDIFVYSGITLAQYISLAIIVICLIWIILMRRKMTGKAGG